MGRPLPSNNPLQIIGLLPVAPLSMFIVFSVFTVVTFLCGSHRGVVKSIRGKEEKKTVIRLGGENKKRVYEKMKSSLSSKMISWRKVQDGNEEEELVEEEEEEVGGEDGTVWKKTIIKGGKCRPLEFSGKILYDSNGNLLSD